MVCAPVRSIIPSLKLGDYLSVQACSTNHALSPTCSMADGISFDVSLSLNCTDFYKREGGA